MDTLVEKLWNCCNYFWRVSGFLDLVTFTEEIFNGKLHFLCIEFTLLEAFTAQKLMISIKDFFSKCDQFPVDLVTFTEEILIGKLYFLCSDCISWFTYYWMTTNYGNRWLIYLPTLIILLILFFLLIQQRKTLLLMQSQH